MGLVRSCSPHLPRTFLARSPHDVTLAECAQRCVRRVDGRTEPVGTTSGAPPFDGVCTRSRIREVRRRPTRWLAEPAVSWSRPGVGGSSQTTAIGSPAKRTVPTSAVTHSCSLRTALNARARNPRRALHAWLWFRVLDTILSSRVVDYRTRRPPLLLRREDSRASCGLPSPAWVILHQPTMGDTATPTHTRPAWARSR